MEPISTVIVVAALIEFGKECGKDFLKEGTINLATKLPKKVIEALRSMEAPVNHHVEKGALAAQWLATKFFAQQIQKHFNKKGANFNEPLHKIEQVASQIIKQIEDDKFLPITDLLSSDEVITLITKEPISQPGHIVLRQRLIQSHLNDVKSLLPSGYWQDRLGFETFENSLSTGWETQDSTVKYQRIDWFELVCAFFNDLLKGDNNKAKDGYHNQILAKISLQNSELKETLDEVLKQFDQRFVADRIGTDFFESLKISFGAEFKSLYNSISLVGEKVDAVKADTEELKVGNQKILQALSKPTDTSNHSKFITPVSVQGAMRMVGRIDDVRQVLVMLEPPSSQVLIYAMKGAGKTTLARAVTKTLLSQDQLDHVVWLNNGNNLLNALIEQIGRTRLREQVDQAYEAKLSAEAIVRQLIVPYLLDKSGYNLLVIDNLTYDQRSDYRRVCQGLSGWRILTTSYEQVGANLDVYPLQLLLADEARELFYRYYESAEQDDASVDTLVSAVGYHTLTIELMAKTANTLGLSPARLLKKFNDRGLALSSLPLDIDSDHSPDPVNGLLPYYEVIFDFSGLSAFEQNLLLQLSILPAVWLNKLFIQSVLTIRQDTDDDELLSIALKSLTNRGWLQEGKLSYLMHQILQAIVRYKLQPTTENCRQTITIFRNVVRQSNESDPISVINLIPYVESILNNLKQESNELINDLYNQQGLLFSFLGNYKIALNKFLETLNRSKALQGEEHPAVAGSYNNLGIVYGNQGDYPAAIEQYQKALTIRLKVLGEEHPTVADSYNNLGVVYDNQGDYPAAIEQYQKALTIRLKVLGEEHPDVADSYNNLGIVYDNQGDYPAAIEQYQKALTIQLKVLGEEHPAVANSYNNLGVVYGKQGDYPAAIEQYQKALTIQLKVLGEEHPAVADSYNNLGVVYRKQGDYLAATEQYQKALTIRLKVLGEEHPAVADSYNNLGVVYNDQGDYPAAIEQYQKALTIQLKVLGEEHPTVADSYNNLGVVYGNQGDYPAAIEQYQKALTIQLKVLGEEHPAVADSYNNLGIVYRKQGDYPATIEQYQKALTIRLKVLGEEHPTVAGSYNNLGVVYDNQGDYPAAIEQYQKALTIRLKVLGEEHPAVAGSYNNLGIVYGNQGDYPAAIEQYQKALTIQLKVLGEEHPAVANSYNNLGVVYDNQGDYPAAIEQYQKALTIQLKVLGEEHPAVADSYNNLGIVYNALLSYGQALQYFLLSLSIMIRILGQKLTLPHGTIQNIENLYENPEADTYFKEKIAQGDEFVIALMYQAVGIFDQLGDESMVDHIEALLRGYK
jgi:tetratricopeptide (TPR) repeat protein